MINVVLADDHGIVRQGIKMVLEDSEDINVIGEASNGKQALEMVEQLSPDVLISDISMPEMSGLELSSHVKENFESTKILILSTHDDEEYILESFEAGALGYLPKDANEEDILMAVKTISDGQIFYTSTVAKIIGASIIRKNSPGKSLKSMLTIREKEILKLLVEGASNKMIAGELFISIRTVDAHRRNIMKKVNVNNAAELVKIAINKRLV